MGYRSEDHISPAWALGLRLFVLSILIDQSVSLKRRPLAVKVRCDSTGACTCPEEPLTERYNDHEDPTCAHYYLCHLGRAFPKRCEYRWAFHPEKKECLPRKQIPEKYCQLPVKCPIWTNRYVEDPVDCTKYYLCFYQQPSHYACEEGAYFDPEAEKCVQDEYQAEACQEQALKDEGDRLKMKAEPEKSSAALSKAQQNAAKLVKKNLRRQGPKSGGADE